MKRISTPEAKELIKKDVFIIDVRTKKEYDEEHIDNAKNIDINSKNFFQEINKLDKNKTYFVYCRSGNRSYAACSYMKKQGFEKVFELKEGFLNW